MSIKDIVQKIKGVDQSKVTDLYIVSIIVLVGFASFGLGRLSTLERQGSGIEIRYPQNYEARVSAAGDTETGTGTIPDGGLLVGSKQGSKYHFPWCSGAQRIKESNKIWFPSAEVARNAGYSPAANCKGLK